ncbi:hypothetical protein D3C71_1837320 [compost metagenome]
MPIRIIRQKRLTAAIVMAVWFWGLAGMGVFSSPQKACMKIRSMEYSTMRLVARLMAVNRYMPASRPPRRINSLPAKPLKGGTPATARDSMKNIHPSRGRLRISPPISVIRPVPAA